MSLLTTATSILIEKLVIPLVFRLAGYLQDKYLDSKTKESLKKRSEERKELAKKITKATTNEERKKYSIDLARHNNFGVSES